MIFEVDDNGYSIFTNVMPFKICVLHNKLVDEYRAVFVYEQANIDFYEEYGDYSIIKIFNPDDKIKAEKLKNELNAIRKIQES